MLYFTMSFSTTLYSSKQLKLIFTNCAFSSLVSVSPSVKSKENTTPCLCPQTALPFVEEISGPVWIKNYLHHRQRLNPNHAQDIYFVSVLAHLVTFPLEQYWSIWCAFRDIPTVIRGMRGPKVYSILHPFVGFAALYGYTAEFQKRFTCLFTLVNGNTPVY